MLIYVTVDKPMYDKFSQIMLFINEIMIYCCAILTFSFTDATYIDIVKYELGDYWIAVIVITLILDFLALAFTVVWQTKKTAEHWLEYRRKN